MIITLYREQADLRGTQYVELQPGRHRGQHWLRGSVFLMDSVWGLIHAPLERRVASYSFFGVTEVGADLWSGILEDWGALRAAIITADRIGDVSGHFELPYATLEAEFNEDFGENARVLADVVRELAQWVQDVLTEEDVITVAGL